MLVRIKGLRCARVQSFFYLLTYSITDILPHSANYARHFFCSLYQICTTKTHILFHTNIKKCQFCDTKSQLFFAAIRGSGSNWLSTRNDYVIIYAFWSLGCGVGRGGREALASTDALTLCPHTRTLFCILPTIHPR